MLAKYLPTLEDAPEGSSAGDDAKIQKSDEEAVLDALS